MHAVPGSQDKLRLNVGQKPAKLGSLEQSVCVQVGSWERRKLTSISAASHLGELESVLYFSEKGGRSQAWAAGRVNGNAQKPAAAIVGIK